MKVVILAGGMGTRLREETEYRPKPMVEVGGRPILWHIMKSYAHYGYDDFAVCLGYRGHMIKEYFLSYEARSSDFTIRLGRNPSVRYHGDAAEDGYRVTLADTGLDTMTGGRLRRAARYIDTDTFLLTYGDGVSDVNVRRLVDFHKRHGRLATVTAVQPYSRFGIMAIDAEAGAVTAFHEKPRVEGWASAGFFVLDRRVLDYCDGDDCVFEQGPLARLAAEDQLQAYRHDGFFFAMDTYRDFLQLNQLWEGGEAPWKVWQ